MVCTVYTAPNGHLDMDKLNGLYLAPPHGNLIATGKKVVIVKSRYIPDDTRFDLRGKHVIVSKESGDGIAYGTVTIGEPSETSIEVFDKGFDAHRVTTKERTRWWPDAQTLYVYPIVTYSPYDEFRAVDVPAGTQTVMRDVKFLDTVDATPILPPVESTPTIPVEVKVAPSDDPTPTDTKSIESEEDTVSDDIKVYSKLSEANPSIRGIEPPVSLAQANAIAKWAHAMETSDDPPESPWAASIAQFKKLYIAKGNAWVKRKEDDDDKTRGEGQGVGEPRQGDSGTSRCVCPECGHEVAHERGTPCNEVKCPECGAAMVGKATTGEGDKAENVADYLESTIHREFTIAADDMFGRGAINRDERIAISSLIGDALDVFHQGLEEQLSDLQTRDTWNMSESAEVEPEPLKVEIVEGDEDDDEEDDKAGRRVRSDKVSILKSLREKLDIFVDELKTVIGWADYDDDKATSIISTAFTTDSGFYTTKSLTDEPYLITWTTNAFVDREGEIFTTESIKELIAHYADKEDKGTVRFWHIPHTDFATIRWQGDAGRFLVEASTFDDTDIGRKMLAFLTAHPLTHSVIAPEGWGTSHGYHYEPEDRKDNVYEWFDKRETTVLPASVASNQHNPQPEVANMEQKQYDALVEIFGDAKAAELVALGEARTKKLEAEGVAFKGKDDEAAETDAQPDAEPDPTPATTDSEKSGNELALEMAEKLHLADLSTSLEVITTSLATIAEQVKANADRLVEVEKADDEKLAEKELKLPRFHWQRMSEAAETVLTADDKLKSARPQVPQAVSGIAAHLS